MFMLGDNRWASTDSRYAEFGEVSRRSTVGRAVFRLYPLSRAGRIRQAACKGGWNYE
jgi:signal peptidase I